MLFLFIRLLHLIGLAWGLGGSTVSALLMRQTERDPSLIAQVTGFHRILSKVIWGGIVLLVLSGVLLAASPASSFQPGVLAAKHILVVIVIFDGLYFTFVGMPALRRLAPLKGRQPGREYAKAYAHLKLVGMVSMLSWYAIVALSALF